MRNGCRTANENYFPSAFLRDKFRNSLERFFDASFHRLGYSVLWVRHVLSYTKWYSGREVGQ